MHSIKLGQYKDLQVKRVQPMTEEELQKTADNAFNDAMKRVEKFTREIKIGDIILVKIEAKTGDEIIKELCKENMEYDVGNMSMLPEYSKAAGKKIGQTFEMHIQYSENCPVQAARGKTVDSKVTILDAKFSTPPEVTDDILKIMDPNAKSADDVKEKLKFMIKNENERSLFENNVLKVMEAIKEKAQLTLDGQEYDRTYHQIIEETAQMYEQSGMPVPEGCENIRQDQHFLDNCKNVTERIVLENLIINAVSEAEKITVSPEEIEKGKKVFTATPESKADFEKHFPDDYTFSAFLLRNKVFDSIMKWNLID